MSYKQSPADALADLKRLYVSDVNKLKREVKRLRGVLAEVRNCWGCRKCSDRASRALEVSR